MVDWVEVEDHFRSNAVPFLHPPNVVWGRVFIGGYEEADLLKFPVTPDTLFPPLNVSSFFGEPGFKGPIDIVWPWGGKEHLVRLWPEDLDAFSHSDFGNISIMDEERKFRDLLRSAKRALDGHRGMMLPSLYVLTRDLVDDLLAYGEDEGSGEAHE